MTLVRLHVSTVANLTEAVTLSNKANQNEASAMLMHPQTRVNVNGLLKVVVSSLYLLKFRNIRQKHF